MNKLLYRLSLFIASGCYLGFFPKFPGTIGSLLPIGVLFFLKPTAFTIFFSTIIILLLGILVSDQIEKKLCQKDPSFVVIDEIGGQLLTFLWVPLTPLNLSLGFLLFRVLDIFKPWPVRSGEKLSGGLGIMADDYLAGLLAALILKAIDYLF